MFIYSDLSPKKESYRIFDKMRISSNEKYTKCNHETNKQVKLCASSLVPNQSRYIFKPMNLHCEAYDDYCPECAVKIEQSKKCRDAANKCNCCYRYGFEGEDHLDDGSVDLQRHVCYRGAVDMRLCILLSFPLCDFTYSP